MPDFSEEALAKVCVCGHTWGIHAGTGDHSCVTPSCDCTAWRDPARPWADEKLPCHGCAHSAARQPFPGFPSGERPCCFCVRNTRRAEWVTKHDEEHEAIVREQGGCKHPIHGYWYDGRLAKTVPGDNYISLDRLKEDVG
jgi:hypothetical protein